MNKFQLSQHDINSQFVDVRTLGELIKRIETKLQEKNEVVCRISVNDLTLSEEDEKHFSSLNVAELQKVEVEHESAVKIFNEVLQSWTESLDKMVLSCDELAQKIRFNGQEGHLGDMVKLIDSCHFLVESLVSMRLLNRSNIDKVLEKWNNNEVLLLRSVEEALGAFEKKDFVLMADVLEYDLANALQCWKELLTAMLNFEQSGDHIEGSHHLANGSSR